MMSKTMPYSPNDTYFGQITLTNYDLIKVTGKDAVTFLQGQLTCDVKTLSDTLFLHACHAMPSGKLIGTIWLYQHDDAIFLITEKSLTENHLAAFKKFAVFSKIIFELTNEYQLTAFCGEISSLNVLVNADTKTLNSNIIYQNDAVFLVLSYPTTRLIAVIKKSAANNYQHIKTLEYQLWQRLNLEANFCVIDVNLTDKYLPQAFNFQQFDAINFKKGCYCGQEMIARAQYRGANKRALFLLKGKSNLLPKANDSLLLKINEHYRKTGCITSSLKLDDEHIYVQAILDKKTQLDDVFYFDERADNPFVVIKK